MVEPFRYGSLEMLSPIRGRPEHTIWLNIMVYKRFGWGERKGIILFFRLYDGLEWTSVAGSGESVQGVMVF